MKTLSKLAVVLFLLTFLAGCSNNQKSSTEEARGSIQNLSDFKEIIQLVNVRYQYAGIAIGFLYSEKNNPPLDQTTSSTFITTNWVAVYKTTNDRFKLVTLDDARPPKVTATSKEFK